MAKKQRNNHVSVSFHYLCRETGGADSKQIPFSTDDFKRIVDRITNTNALDLKDDKVINRIKFGYDLPFLYHEKLSEYQHFGRFEGASYGQQFRNSKVGIIDAESLNLRPFYYLVSLRRDGKIIVGTQYLGNYGDYEGLSSCFKHLLNGGSNLNIQSRTFSSIHHEIDGVPTEVQVRIRKRQQVIGRKNLFSNSSMIVIKKSDYGETFADDVMNQIAPKVQGDYSQRRKAIAEIVSAGELIDVNDEDIEGCTVIVRKDKSQKTIYLLGGTNFATRFSVDAKLDNNGLADSKQVKQGMLKILDQVVTPGLS